MNHQHNRNCDSFRTFAENKLGYVGICDGCRVVSVAFQNSLFCLTLEQFEGFCEMIQDRLAMRPFYTGHGKELLMMTPMPNYFLLFSEADLGALTDLLCKAAPVLAAECILGVTRWN